MAEGFKIEVPITIKGGREGEKIGTQIGEKIAAQLKKTFKSINIGGAKTGGMDSTGVLGITKGLKGVATKLGIIGVAIAASVRFLSKSSPYLKGILSIFGRAFMIFFRPFGDFLATLLRPMAILLMKMAVAFLKWMRPLVTGTREAMEGVPQFQEVDNALGNFALGIANWALQIGAAIGDLIFNIGKGAFDLGVKIGQWFYDEVIVPVADFIKRMIGGLFGGRDRGVANTLVGAVTGSRAGGAGGGVSSVVSAITGGTGGGATVGGGSGAGSVIASVVGAVQKSRESIISRTLAGTIGKLIGGLFGGKGQVGIPKVQKDGLFFLHRGEEVVTRNNQSKSVTLNQNLNFSGPISSEVDVDAIARRSSKIIEMELRQRGVL